MALNGKTKRRFKKSRVSIDGATLCCHYCGHLMHFDDATIDHVVPLANGGSDSKDNLVIACVLCNQDKSDQDYHTFKRNCELGTAGRPGWIARRRQVACRRLSEDCGRIVNKINRLLHAAA